MNESFAEFGKAFDARAHEASCLCGQTRGWRILVNDRYGIPIEPTFCQSCGHVYARWRLEGADLADFYATTYRKLYADGARLRAPQKIAKKVDWAKTVILPMFDELCGDLPSATVIEWGCSGGWNLIPFRERGAEVSGFDYDQEMITFGRESFHLDLVGLESADAHPTSSVPAADFMIVNHVLEHVPEPFEQLKTLADTIKPTGFMFVGLPFLERIGDWGFREFFHVAHLHYFSIPRFLAGVGVCGLEAVRIDKRAGCVVLRRTGHVVAAGEHRTRLHNAMLLAGFGCRDLLTDAPRRQAAALLRRFPSVARLRRARHI